MKLGNMSKKFPSFPRNVVRNFLEILGNISRKFQSEKEIFPGTFLKTIGKFQEIFPLISKDKNFPGNELGIYPFIS
jgi:hypothetical protein